MARGGGGRQTACRSSYARLVFRGVDVTWMQQFMGSAAVD